MMRPLEAEYPGEHNYSRATVSPVLSLQPKLRKSAPARFQIIFGSRVPPGSKREVQPDWSQRWTLPWPLLGKVFEDRPEADVQTRLCELTQS